MFVFVFTLVDFVFAYFKNGDIQEILNENEFNAISSKVKCVPGAIESNDSLTYYHWLKKFNRNSVEFY